MRVSTKQQEYKSQLARARRQFVREGLEFPPDEHVYAEKQSAFRDDSLTKRKRLQSLITALEAGELAGFYALRVNRLFRNAKIGLAVYDILHRLRARVVFIDNPRVDIYTHEGRKWFLGDLAGAEAWSLEHAVRVRDGKAAAAESGRTNASRAGYGAVKRRGVLKWVRPGALVVRDALTIFHEEPDATAASISDRLFEKYGERFTAQTIIRWIKAPRYYGLVRHAPSQYGQLHATTEEIKRAKLRKAKWKPLVKRSWYHDNIAKLWSHAHGGKGAHRPSQTRHAYIFGGGELLHCATCNGTLFGEMRLASTKSGQYRAGYLCTHAKRRRGKGESCSVRGKAIYEDDLVQQVGHLIEQIVPPDDWVQRIAEDARQMRVNTDAARRKRRAIQARRDEAALKLARKKMTLEAFTAFDAALDAEERAIDEAPSPTVSDAQIEAMIADLASLRVLWQRANGDQRRRLVQQLFTRIWVNLFTKRVVKVEARAPWGMILRTVPAFTPLDGDVFAVQVSVDEDERAIIATLRELGKATAYAIGERMGVSGHALRNTLRRMHDAGIIAPAGFAMLPTRYTKRAQLWTLTESA